MTPKKINVLGHTYRIIEKPKMSESAGHDGLCDATNKIIYLDKGLHKEDKLRVLMHEIMHAYQFESGFCDVLDRQAQELLAEGMAGFLSSILVVKFR